MYAKCNKCNSNWNISIKTDLSKPYVCPMCIGEERQVNFKISGAANNKILDKKYRR